MPVHGVVDLHVVVGESGAWYGEGLVFRLPCLTSDSWKEGEIRLKVFV